jgi:hypothetical protein
MKHWAHRRFFRLAVVIAIFGILAIREYQHQCDRSWSRAYIRSRGAYVETESSGCLWGDMCYKIIWQGSDVSDDELIHVLRNAPCYVSLKGNPRISDRGMAMLSRLYLREVNIKYTSVTLTGIRAILESNPHCCVVHSVVDLHANGGGPGIARAAKCLKANKAGIETNIDGEIVALTLEAPGFSTELLGHLSALRKLRRITFGGNVVVVDAHLKPLGKITSLRQVDLSFSQITNDGLRYLSGLKELQYLDLPCTQITEAGLAHLKQLPQLKEVVLSETLFVGGDNLSRLNRSLPFRIGWN